MQVTEFTRHGLKFTPMHECIMNGDSGRIWVVWEECCDELGWIRSNQTFHPNGTTDQEIFDYEVQARNAC